MSYVATWSEKYGPLGPLVLGIPPEEPIEIEEVAADCSKYIRRCKELESLVMELWDSAMIPEELHKKIENTLHRSAKTGSSY